jgi:hypothetical protein
MLRELGFYSIPAPQNFTAEETKPTGNELKLAYREIENVARAVILQIWPSLLFMISDAARLRYQNFPIRLFFVDSADPNTCSLERVGSYYDMGVNLRVPRNHPQLNTINSIVMFPTMASLLKSEMGIYVTGHKFKMIVRVNDTTLPSV